MRIFIDDSTPQKTKRQKGIFGFFGLPAASQYLHPEKQILYLKGIAIIGAVIFALWLIDVLFFQGISTTAGPVSSVHANFGNDCSKCHAAFTNAADSKCSSCHEKAVRPNNQLGVYSYAAHYVYRSNDSARARIAKTKDDEQPCRTCHVEHRGRNNKLVAVRDSECLACHDFDSFTQEHPEFQFVREQMPDDSVLIFTHIKHVREVLKQEKSKDTETACLYCHNPKFDGKLFNAISYDKHCANCHLQNVNTSPLPIATPDQDGVLTLETIRANPSIASLWADAYDPNLFEIRPGNRIVKKRVAHKDPWIIYNLNQLSGQDSGLAQLASSAGERDGFIDMQAQMRMALQRLSGSGNDELQRQMARADSMVMKLSIPDSMLLNGANVTNGVLAQKIAQPCLECHALSGGVIQWVDGRQAQLVRANFNHRAHIVQRKCLDCHSRIVINPSGADSLRAVKADRSIVQNLPDRETCVTCHNGNDTTQRCTTCHEFHP